MSELTMWIAESAARASVLAAVAAAMLVLLRARDAALRSAVWNAVAAVSLLMPLAVYLMPPLFLRTAAPVAPYSFTVAPEIVFTSLPVAAVARPGIGWLAGIYLAGFTVALAHLGVGLVAALRLRRRATPTAIPGVYESREIGVPVTTGWLRPAILLPAEWRAWEPRKLDAVLLHEHAHVARGDFFFHTLTALHRAVYWFNPLAWWMQRNLAALAEQASDDLALAQVEDRALYAEVLFSFVNQPRLVTPAEPAVAMARRGAAVGERIDRVLDESRPLARPVRRSWLASILVTSGVALCASSALSLAQAPPTPPAPAPVPAPAPAPAPAAAPARPLPPPPPPPPASRRRYRTRTSDSESIDVREDRIHYERDGQRYLITDPQVIKAFQKMQQPMADLGRRQAELGARQAELGRQQAEVAVDTTELNAKVAAQVESIRSAAAGKTKMTQADLGELQSHLSGLQHELSQLQHAASLSQHDLGRRQHTLGQQQHELGRRQHEEAQRAQQAERALLDEAIRNGKAKPVE